MSLGIGTILPQPLEDPSGMRVQRKHRVEDVLDKPVPHDKCEPLEEYVPGHGKGRQQGFLLPGLDSNQQPSG
jgi:hypothetical protein